VLPLSEKASPVAVQAEPRFTEERGRFSPDGKWIAFSTNESGAFEVFVRTFPGNERKLQISTGGGTQPHWSPDGKELYYISGEGMLMAVPVRSWNPFEPGTPVPLFPKPGFNGSDGGSYVPANDGSRFLVIQPLSAAQAVPLTVIQNWPAALRK
jgi:Tol biopolymer transport system component